jgi:hypothetical protein
VEERDRRRSVERRELDRRMLQAWIGGLLLLVCALSLGFAFWVVRQSNEVNRQRALAQSRELAANAERVRDEDPQLAMLLALAGIEREPTPEARSALINAMRYAWPLAALSESNIRGWKPESIALSSDGNTLAVLSATGVVTLWNVSVHEPALVPWTQAVSRPDATEITFSPDGSRLALARTNAVELLDTKTGKSVHAFEQDETVGTVAFSNDGRCLAATAVEEAVRVWDLKTARPKASKADAPGAIAVALLPSEGDNYPNILEVGIDEEFRVRANLMQRAGTGEWSSSAIDLFDKCHLRPHSISPGSSISQPRSPHKSAYWERRT